MRITARCSTLAILVPLLTAFSFRYPLKSESRLTRHEGLFIKKSLTTKADSFPPYRGWTNDFFGLYTPEQVAILDSITGAFEKKTSIEICVVTIDSSMTSKEEFNNWIMNLHNAWASAKKTWTMASSLASLHHSGKCALATDMVSKNY